MCCLSKSETLQAYWVLLELEKLRDEDDPCFQEESNKLVLWIVYLVIASPLFYIAYCLMVK